MRAFLLSVSALALVSCATDDDPANGLQSITIDQGPCYGFCPVYDITVTPDDRFVLNGIQHTRNDGRSSGTLADGAFDQIAASFADVGFRTLPENLTYGAPDRVCPGPQVSDMPYFEFTGVYADMTKTVRWYQGCHYEGMRELLTVVHDAIDLEERIQIAR
jgi:Domain of unknown function (DUF6438)